MTDCTVILRHLASKKQNSYTQNIANRKGEFKTVTVRYYSFYSVLKGIFKPLRI